MSFVPGRYVSFESSFQTILVEKNIYKSLGWRQSDEIKCSFLPLRSDAEREREMWNESKWHEFILPDGDKSKWFSTSFNIQSREKKQKN